MMHHSPLTIHRSLFSLLPTPYSLLPLLLLLTGCNEFERTAYRTLAVSQAEYETVQRHVAEAAVHGLITEEQWNRFAVAGHRFIDAHNAAVDAFELWSRAKNPANEARVLALLEILPRLVRELNSLAGSFESEPRPEGSGEKEIRSQMSGVRSQNENETVKPQRHEEAPVAEKSNAASFAFLLTS